MKNWFAGVKRWWLRRFRGYVAAPPRSGGTSWQQHYSYEFRIECVCGQWTWFVGPKDYVIRSQDHREGCDGWNGFQPGSSRCDCPVTDARYVKICPHCGLGHWRQA